jgi:hypothetical protein
MKPEFRFDWMFERMVESRRLAAVGGRTEDPQVTGSKSSAPNLPERLFSYLGGAILFFFG